jgi:hypothetical protein
MKKRKLNRIIRIEKRYFKETLILKSKQSKIFIPSPKRIQKRTEPFIPMNPLLDGIFRTTN